MGLRRFLLRNARDGIEPARRHEYNQHFTQVGKRLEQVYNQLRLHDGAMLSLTDTMMAVLYRFCRLVLQVNKKDTPLDRFLGRHATTTKLQDFHDELDHFIESYSLDINDQLNWKIEWEEGQLIQQQRFEKTLCSDDALAEGASLNKRYERRMLLHYQLQQRGADNSSIYSTDLKLLHEVSARYMQVYGMTILSNVHGWFVSPDDVEFHEWDVEREDTCGGTWLKTTITIAMVNWKNYKRFEQFASRWYQLAHPYVLKLLGACHLGEHPFFIYEYDSNRTTLNTFLAAASNHHLAWECLHKVALGLQYLHQRKCVHGKLNCSKILIGPDCEPKIGGFKSGFVYVESHEAPELAKIPWATRKKHVSFVSDIYAFGVCLVEALVWTLISNNVQDAFNEIIKNVRDRARGTSTSIMSDAQWDLIMKMCAYDPSERVPIAFVVNRLQSFSFNKFDGDMCNIGSQIIRQSNRGVEWMIQKVHLALEYIYDCLIQLKYQPTDSVVTRFCYLLARTEEYLRTAVSATSVARLARSQKVAEVNHVLYAELDRILDLLDAPSDDAIRSWKQDDDDIDKQIFGNATSVRSSCIGGTMAKTDAVTLTHYDSQHASSFAQSNDNMWDQSGRPIGDSPPKWYLALREIVFQESDTIGEGAFGRAYRGTWLGTPVVVKFMGYEEDPGTVSAKLLLREIRVWHQLSRPHVVKLYGANYIGKRYFVCEYAPNGNLKAYLRKREYNQGDKWRKLYEVALGVQHMHSLNIIHNDIKCDNILIGAQVHVEVIDFGLSCIPGVTEIQVDPKKMGALHWKAPEYIQGERPAIATDISSLAMCILEVLTGDIPWGRNMIDAVVRVRVKQGVIPNRPEKLNDTQWNLVKLMTKTDPSQRVKIAFAADKLAEIVHDEARKTSTEQGPLLAP